MADTTFKRVLTDEIKDATRATDQAAAASGTPDELYLKLRNIGSRARKSVLEGYQTAPSAFSRAQSTGALGFRPMNDILRDVYSQPLASTSTLPVPTTRKRARSVSEHDEDAETETESAMCVEADASGARAAFPVPATDQPRPIRPLRTSSRAFLKTRSLPASAFSAQPPAQPTPTPTPHCNPVPPPLEEEDWSESTSAFTTSESTLDFGPVDFEPMAFD